MFDGRRAVSNGGCGMPLTTRRRARVHSDDVMNFDAGSGVCSEGHARKPINVSDARSAGARACDVTTAAAAT